MGSADREGHLRVLRARLVDWLYLRLGSRYWIAMGAARILAAGSVSAITVLALATFWPPSPLRFLILAAVAIVVTSTAITVAALRTRYVFRDFWEWHLDPDPTPQATVAVWEEVATALVRNFRRTSLVVAAVAVLPGCALAAWMLQAGWAGFAAMVFACCIPAAYGTVLAFSTAELLGRPLMQELALRLPDGFSFEIAGLRLTQRLKISIPVYTATAGSLSVALLGHQRGAGDLAMTALVVVAVSLFLSIELTVLLGDAITTPVSMIRRQLLRVRGGDYAARASVLASDELGELARDFNEMAHGLEEREEIREAFGTYMDRDVVELILSGEFPPEGVEVTASILFCDVRGFTSYAEKATAPEVIATLNEMFSVMVPIVERHGGHVDKFLGDGLLAVFGAPAFYVDHADRAVAAACEIAAAIEAGTTGLRVGAGVNTGRVVAGPLGGAGRLNFSVIGDAVNVAARVEAATRETGDDVLFTDATRQMFTGRVDSVSRGALPLKGKAEPLELFAPVPSLDRSVAS